MQKAIIFLNGEPPSNATIEKIDVTHSYVICADGAYDYAKRFCKPDLLVGDFDSLQDLKSLKDVPYERFPAKKNSTDSQLAVRRAAERGCTHVDIYGSFGGRRDHEAVNFSLLAYADSLHMRAVLRGDGFDVFFLTPKFAFCAEMKKGKTVSLVPYNDKVHILNTKGLLYHAEDAFVDKINVFTTSNVTTGGDVEYSLSDGTALLFVQK